MKRFLTFFLVFLSVYIFAQPRYLQHNLNGGTYNGTTDIELNDFGAARNATVQANGTATRSFLFPNQSAGYNPKWVGSTSDFSRSKDSKLSGAAFHYTSGGWDKDLEVSVTNGNYYTFIIGENPTSNNDLSIIETTFNPVVLSTVSRSPSAGTISASQPVTVNITTASSVNGNEVIYVRYSTNNFSSSMNVAATGSGTNWSATIPATNSNATVNFYTFSSKSGLSFSSGDSDFYTLKINNNSGANYSYITDVALKVEISDFIAVKETNSTTLKWVTSSEKNNTQFNIQRSANNQTWQTIGSVKATNNPSGAKYNYVDDAPLSNINYYRLQMVDNDGKMTYSKVVAVSAEGGKKSFAVYPNPVKSELNLLTDGNTEGISIYDMTGRAVLQFKDKRSKVNVSDLPNGVYFVRLMDKNGLASEPVRFVKQ